jgi:type II secretory pathway pseudopilin PulG
MRDGKDNTFMELARLADVGPSDKGRSRLDDGGFIMVALLVAMAISAIWLATMLPAWRQQAIRQREQDLIFRGQQYARAIALYYLADGCTLPRDADMLVSRHFLRKKWKDPIADDDFVPLVAGSIQGATGTQTQGQQQIAGGGRPAGTGAPGGAAQLVGLYGVSSKSTDTSITVYQNQQQYSLWSFRYTDALQLMGRPGGCNAQGQPNQPNNGNGRTPPGGPGTTPGQPPPGQGPRPGQPGGPFPTGPGGLGNGRPPGAGTPTGPPPPGIGSGSGSDFSFN